MPVLSQLKIELAPKEVVHFMQLNTRAPSRITAEIQNAIYHASKLIMPRVIYEWVKVLTVQTDRVAVSAYCSAHEVSLYVGSHTDLLTEAQMVLASVMSIGPQLDVRVRELNKAGEFLLAYLLDSLGVIALSKVGEIVCTLAEKEAKIRNWGVGPFLGPGHLDGWALSNQAELCSLFPIKKIGVYLNEQGVLFPLKSVSGIIGAGPKYASKKVGSACRFCMHHDNCWRQKTEKSPRV